ncbi:Mitochondrial carrier protein [Penicillium chermesinum]|uniref:Mitochondrial carrier protein n=1 Tax=Penicillium chermesinum TaxID=63820 RepID=A0A9W9NCL7_9EURO|nr:Mitochondrial carrier protein [Penicillium chermesinum]KAJ5217390.1 Mitochondrial carrier protein [Penicillium chermesinum]KAJ6170998.1 Mitochondrial carrier protein [Penicillium chermesinum]
MASDFWAGYLSGALGIVIGNPLDIVKVRLQAGESTHAAAAQLNHFEKLSSLIRGAAAPILGYGALNAILFVAYNRSLKILDPTITDPTNLAEVPLYKIWAAGAAGGLASWTISSPTEFIKCRAQLDTRSEVSSWSVTKDICRRRGWRGLYYGGGITAARDAIGYGFYFWSYELCKGLMTSEDESSQQAALKVLLSGGIAGIVTWGSVFPLDMIKTRLQAQTIHDRAHETPIESQRPLLGAARPERSSFQIAREIYHAEGLKPFYRGLGVCSIRAFVVNAVQWAAYEWLMKKLNGN